MYKICIHVHYAYMMVHFKSTFLYGPYSLNPRPLAKPQQIPTIPKLRRMRSSGHPSREAGRQGNTTSSVIVIDDAGAVLVRLGDAIASGEIILLRLALCVKIRALSSTADANRVATVRREAIACRVVLLIVSACYYHHRLNHRGTYAGTIVPKSNVALVPLESDLNLGRGGHNLVKQTDDVVALRLRNSNNFSDKSRVEEEAFPSGDWVCANKRVRSGHRLTTHRATELTSALGLHVGRVNGSERLEILLHVGGKHIVGCVLAGPESVSTTTSGWAGKDLE